MSLTTQWSRIEQMQGEEAAAAAWQWFVERYRDFVAATLRRIVWDVGRAAAATDEFWGYLFQHEIVGRLRRGMRFRSFLITTLRNYALDWLRRNPRPAAEDPTALERATTTLLAEEEEMAIWTRQIVHLALQRLEREHHRHAHVLRAFYGVAAKPDAEPPAPRAASAIADEQGLTDNALHQLLFRARLRLRECVVEEVRQTVSTRGDLDGELALLTQALVRTMPGLM